MSWHIERSLIEQTKMAPPPGDRAHARTYALQVLSNRTRLITQIKNDIKHIYKILLPPLANIPTTTIEDETDEAVPEGANEGMRIV